MLIQFAMRRKKNNEHDQRASIPAGEGGGGERQACERSKCKQPRPHVDWMSIDRCTRRARARAPSVNNKQKYSTIQRILISSALSIALSLALFLSVQTIRGEHTRTTPLQTGTTRNLCNRHRINVVANARQDFYASNDTGSKRHKAIQDQLIKCAARVCLPIV